MLFLSGITGALSSSSNSPGDLLQQRHLGEGATNSNIVMSSELPPWQSAVPLAVQLQYPPPQTSNASQLQPNLLFNHFQSGQMGITEIEGNIHQQYQNTCPTQGNQYQGQIMPSTGYQPTLPSYVSSTSYRNQLPPRYNPLTGELMPYYTTWPYR